MSINPPIRFSHSHHLLRVKGGKSALDVLAFEGDEALSLPFSYRIEFTSPDHAISKEMMLMKAASLTLQAPVDQGYGIKIQQPVRVIQGVVTGFERLGTAKDETHYALTLRPRLALLDRSHQNAIYQDMSVPQIVEKILRERHAMRGQDFLFSLSKEYRGRLHPGTRATHCCPPGTGAGLVCPGGDRSLGGGAAALVCAELRTDDFRGGKGPRPGGAARHFR